MEVTANLSRIPHAAAEVRRRHADTHTLQEREKKEPAGELDQSNRSRKKVSARHESIQECGKSCLVGFAKRSSQIVTVTKGPALDGAPPPLGAFLGDTWRSWATPLFSKKLALVTGFQFRVLRAEFGIGHQCFHLIPPSALPIVPWACLVARSGSREATAAKGPLSPRIP